MNSTTSHGHGERLRMRPWIEKKLNEGFIPGLLWEDKENGIFRVPWKHAGKPDFVLERDAILFKEWAKHTGKYLKDGEQEEPSTWKTRFRCALRKLPDVEELKERSRLDGEEPYRVFQFLSKELKIESQENAYSPSHANIAVSPVPAVDQTSNSQIFANYRVMDNGDDSVDELQATILGNFTEPSLWSPTEHMVTDFSSSYDTNDFLNDYMRADDMLADFSPTPQIQTQPPQVGVLDSNEINEIIGMNPETMNVGVKVFYHEKQVLERVVDNRYGCRLYSGVDFTKAADYTGDFARVYGPPEVEQIQFPEQGSQVAVTDKLNRGLLLQWHQNNIHVTRICPAHVFASGGCLGTNIVPLKRNETTKVFDYNHFLSGLAEYKLSKAPVPLYEVFFAFGQQPATSTTVDPGVLITVSVTHMNAKASISKMGSGSDVIMSIEDDFDVLAKQMQQVVKLQQKNF